MKKILFYIALCLASTLYFLQKLQVPIPAWLNNYVNDFLVLPLVLSICLYSVQKIKKDQQIRLSLPLIAVITLMYCFYFEWYLPQHNARYTADYFDCLLYFGGAFVFYLLQPAKKNTQQLT